MDTIDTVSTSEGLPALQKPSKNIPCCIYTAVLGDSAMAWLFNREAGASCALDNKPRSSQPASLSFSKGVESNQILPILSVTGFSCQTAHHIPRAIGFPVQFSFASDFNLETYSCWRCSLRFGILPVNRISQSQRAFPRTLAHSSQRNA